MITRAVVVPQPPLLVPEIAAGARESTADLRAACLAAAGRLTETADRWVAVGAGEDTVSVTPPSACGSFRGYGVDLGVGLSERTGAPAELPLPALITGWLRARVGAAEATVHSFPVDTPAERSAKAAELIAERHSGHGLLVLGDGANRHGPRSPGGEHDGAPAFDAAIAKALATADAEALLALDADLCAELGAGGRFPWQVLASLAEGATWTAELLYSEAPFGVGYHVAVWTRA
ncbi:class III extradiol dioxygenase subunit B-like domain-containing protein [Amycolatopsis sp. YIM 10]|uniref:class III extradiol dioxygenase subunit B-like domain-containing protein n=1 Tax=Amycolatopsis sp. YIM 10 TaxID=2653857 RepID=UPI0012906183|nr:class III extradiol dioxygenase subunit B-like domain-containing protein [Amycolatopsis sp. YIM 10]